MSSVDGIAEGSSARTSRVRMTGTERREQLLDVGRSLFAERGFEATSIEELAARAGVSKPVVYEHFGGKEGLYAVVVDREMQSLTQRISSALTGGHPREACRAGGAGPADLHRGRDRWVPGAHRDSPVASGSGTFSSLLNDIANQVEYILAGEFERRGLQTELAGMYAQMLVGMVALTGHVVVGRARALARSGRGASGEPGLERIARARGRPSAQHLSRGLIAQKRLDLRRFLGEFEPLLLGGLARGDDLAQLRVQFGHPHVVRGGRGQLDVQRGLALVEGWRRPARAGSVPSATPGAPCADRAGARG